MNHKIGVMFVLFSAMAWSTAGLFARVVTTDIPTTLFWRSLFGGFCVLAIYLFTLQPQRKTAPNQRVQNWKNTLRDTFHFSLGEIAVGVLSTSGGICFISAFFYTTIANVTFVYGTMPLVTFILALVFLKEKPSLIALIACALCIVGVTLMLNGAQKLDDQFGVLLAFGMTFFMASLTIATKYFPEVNVIKVTYLSGFLGALVTFPFSSFVGAVPIDYFWLVLYGVVNLGLGFGVYLLGVQRVTATAAALLGIIEIPIAPIWAWLLFRENPGLYSIIGGAIILFASIFYLSIKHIKKETEKV